MERAALKIIGSELRRQAGAVILAAVVFWLVLQPKLLYADGGTLRLSQKCGGYQVSVFTTPEVLRSGPIDISVLVQDAATGNVRDDIPVRVRLEKINSSTSDELSVALEQSASFAAATNKLFQAVTFDLPLPGTWQATVMVGDKPPHDSASPPMANSNNHSQSLTFELAVAPPLPPWLELGPWIGWPFVSIALFLMHQWLKYARDHAPIPRAKTCNSVGAS